MTEFGAQEITADLVKSCWESLTPFQQRDVLILKRILGTKPWEINTSWKEQIIKTGRSGPNGQSQFKQEEITKDFDLDTKKLLSAKTVDRLWTRLENTPAQVFLDEITTRAKREQAEKQDTNS